jgi:DNA-directed RNA polymerase specialized sigma24 family protein
MNKISPVMLNDTLNLIQLARETARQQGQKAQAERLSPLVDGLRSVAQSAQENQPIARPSGVLAQDDFKTLLSAAQSAPQTGAARPAMTSAAERSQMAVMMASGGMSDMEIARHMGMTRDEVQLILSVNRRGG